MVVSYVANIITYTMIGVVASHIVLLLLIAAEDADFFNFRLKQSFAHGVAKGACTAGNEINLSLDVKSSLFCGMNSVAEDGLRIPCSLFQSFLFGYFNRMRD